ncbi:MAG: hypothetical protein ACI9V1_003287 [Spirosomataceae bacterium]|jgi:hypothetical protein
MFFDVEFDFIPDGLIMYRSFIGLAQEKDLPIRVSDGKVLMGVLLLLPTILIFLGMAARRTGYRPLNDIASQLFGPLCCRKAEHVPARWHQAQLFQCRCQRREEQLEPLAHFCL